MTALSEAIRSVASGEAKHVLLSSVARIVSGGTPKTGEATFWNGDIPWATPKDLSGLDSVEIHRTARRITESGLRNCSAEILPENSVLFSSRAPIGLLAINTTPMATNQGFKSFVPDPEKLDSRYLFRWLEANRAKLQNMGVGATFKEVSKAIVARLVIPLPALDEQRRIAAIMDRTDGLRTQRRKSLALLDTLTQSIFHDMFGVLSDGAHLWPRVPIGDTCSEIVDCVNRTAPLVDGPTPYKMIRTSNVRNREIDLSSVRYVSRETFDVWNRRATPQRGDVVLTREAPMGEAGQILFDDSVFLGQRTMLYRPNPLKLSSTYLLYYLTSGYMKRDFERYGSGTTVKHLSVPYCRSISIHLPPIELQREFAQLVAAVEQLRQRQRGQLAKLDDVFDSLQHRAFKGEL